MAVARCCLQRAFAGFSLRNSNQYQNILPDLVKYQHHNCPSIIRARNYSSYTSSRPVDKLRSLTDYEIRQSPPEWKYVERLLPLKTIPKPSLKDEYPSGWKPQDPDCINHPYYVKRSKSHMLPVYLDISHRGLRRLTLIRHVEGDIWALSQEIKAHLIEKNNLVIVVRVHELVGEITVRGDFVLDVRDFLLEKGF